MELKDLRCFVLVYEARGFGCAAKAMAMSQSGVSARIGKLEQEIGGLLFQRLHRAIAPTPRGEKLYRIAKKMLAQAEQAEAAMKDDKVA